MFKQFIFLSTLSCACGLLVSSTMASERIQEQKQEQVQGQKRIFGWQLMTPEERDEYREKMRSLKTREERDAFRLAHHKKMQERAKEIGATIPDMPPALGRGMGPGGGGIGPGGGRY